MAKLLSLMLLASTCHANEAEELAKIMYAEDRQSIQGTMQVSNAAINRAEIEKKPIGKISGVQRKPVPKKDKPYFIAIAQAALNSPRLNDADSWDSGTKPHLPGVIRAQVGGQVFYKQRR
jgi:hypothetical protein